MSSAREEILGRIRTALSSTTPELRSYDAVPRAYHSNGSLDRDARLHLLKDRLLDYDAEVIEVAAEADLPAAIGAALHRAGELRLLAAEAFPTAWLPNGVEVVVDAQLPIERMEGIEAVVTTCEVAVASTGTILLVHDGAQGRRAITLLPDHHICLVRRGQVHDLLPEALAAIAGRSAMAITMISGPSATSDIEMTRIRGVHGPRRLTVVLYDADPSS